MINEILLYAGSVIIIIWGLSHIFPTRSVVKGFGDITEDNKKIITMEWIAEGLTLCFIGGLVLIITLFEGIQCYISFIVYRMCAVMLLLMAGLTAVTGARTKIIAIKLCPIVKTIVAIMFLLGNVL